MKMKTSWLAGIEQLQDYQATKTWTLQKLGHNRINVSLRCRSTRLLEPYISSKPKLPLLPRFNRCHLQLTQTRHES